MLFALDSCRPKNVEKKKTGITYWTSGHYYSDSYHYHY